MVFAYDNVCKASSAQFKFPFTEDHLKDRLKNIKVNFNFAQDMMKLSKCFGWDEEINNLKVEREVWKAVIEVFIYCCFS